MNFTFGSVDLVDRQNVFFRYPGYPISRLVLLKVTPRVRVLRLSLWVCGVIVTHHGWVEKSIGWIHALYLKSLCRAAVKVICFAKRAMVILNAGLNETKYANPGESKNWCIQLHTPKGKQQSRLVGSKIRYHWWPVNRSTPFALLVGQNIRSNPSGMCQVHVPGTCQTAFYLKTSICSRGFHPGNEGARFCISYCCRWTARTNRETAYKDTRG